MVSPTAGQSTTRDDEMNLFVPPDTLCEPPCPVTSFRTGLARRVRNLDHLNKGNKRLLSTSAYNDAVSLATKRNMKMRAGVRGEDQKKRLVGLRRLCQGWGRERKVNVHRQL